MKNRFIISLSISLILTLMISVFSGCNSDSNNKNTNLSGNDTSKKVDLVFYMAGDPPKDLPKISDEVNKLTQKDLNCSVKFNYTSWTDVGNKYNLLLSSGQNIDLLFTADWMNYNQYAKKNAFMALDELVPKYAPDLNSFIPKDYWDGVKISDKIYTIPATWKEYVPNGLVYRGDLAKKYNLPLPDSIEHLEQYLDGIKKNEPNTIPMFETSVEYGGVSSFTTLTLLDMKYPYTDKGMLNYGLMSDYNTPSKVRDYWGSQDFVNDLKLFRKWNEKGFWSKSALSSKNDGKQMFIDGQIASIDGQNPVKYSEVLQQCKIKHPEWEISYYPYPESLKMVHPVHPTHNGFAIPKSAKNPERALMFYQKLVLDKTYNRLTEYGIEGTNYEITSDNHYKMKGTTETNGFAHEAMNGWPWRNPQYNLFDPSFDIVLDLFKRFDTYQTPDIWTSFVEDYTPYQSQRSALLQVETQYLAPLMAGNVADVDNGIKSFLDKTKAAGLDKIQTEWKKQWSKYCEEKGLK
jgi:putative aldouronate transport system substrate-binding protein